MSTKSYTHLTWFEAPKYLVYFFHWRIKHMNLPTIIISVILVIIICIGNRSTKKRATSGCCGSSEATRKDFFSEKVTRLNDVPGSFPVVR